MSNLFPTPRVLLSLSHSYCISASTHFTMVTPGNVLVPPIWHFILLCHPVPSAFPSPHTGITLIMIIAVMIMISTAKLHPFSLSHIQHPGDYDWLKSCLKMFPSSHFFSAAPDPSLFLLFLFIYYLAFSYFGCSLHSLLSPSPAYLLSLFSLFQFDASLSSVLLCSFQPFPVHLTSATCPRLPPFLSPGFQPLLFYSSPSPRSSPLRPAYSATTKEQDKLDF